MGGPKGGVGDSLEMCGAHKKNERSKVIKNDLGPPPLPLGWNIWARINYLLMITAVTFETEIMKNIRFGHSGSFVLCSCNMTEIK
jgi:hypothetical protein